MDTTNNPPEGADGTPIQKLGRPYYYLELGYSALVNERWSMKFEAVLDDSRCPEGIKCETAGTATVRVQIEDKNTETYAADLVELKVDRNVRLPNGELNHEMFRTVNIQRQSSDGDSINWNVTLCEILSMLKYESDYVKYIEGTYKGIFRVEEL